MTLIFIQALMFGNVSTFSGYALHSLQEPTAEFQNWHYISFVKLQLNNCPLYWKYLLGIDSTA